MYSFRARYAIYTNGNNGKENSETKLASNMRAFCSLKKLDTTQIQLFFSLFLTASLPMSKTGEHTSAAPVMQTIRPVIFFQISLIHLPSRVILARSITATATAAVARDFRPLSLPLPFFPFSLRHRLFFLLTQLFRVDHCSVRFNLDGLGYIYIHVRTCVCVHVSTAISVSVALIFICTL